MIITNHIIVERNLKTIRIMCRWFSTPCISNDTDQCIFRTSKAEMGSCTPSLRPLVLVLGLVFSHVTCQEFLPKIQSFDPKSPRPNQRGLICRVQTGTGLEVAVLNAVFYLNGSDVRNKLTVSDFKSSTGKITFNITPDLEGCYTCGNGTHTSPAEDALKLVCKAFCNIMLWA